MALRYLSVCSGIEAASVAWEPLGWTPVAFAEIERFPSRVLATRWPSVPNLGDFTAIDPARLGPVDLLVGGTPCQAFSVAGKRGSLADARGNLTLAFVDLAHGLADAAGCRWAVWENVPGVLSTPDNAFGCFLGRLVGGDDALSLPGGAERWPDAGLVAGPRARAAWRILDAQYFGLAQRRRRVFVVVGLADGADPAAVLFEPKGLRRYPPSRGEAGERATVGALAGTSTGGGWRIGADEAAAGQIVPVAFGGNDTRGPIDIATALNAHGGPCGRQDFESETFVVAPERPICFDPRQTDVLVHGDLTAPLDTKFPGPAIAFTCKDHGQDIGSDIAPTLRAMQGAHANAGGQVAVAAARSVRRLTPTECHRLQGFPDDHAAIEGAADGPIYKALGNSKAVPVVRWIGARLQTADATLTLQAAE